MESSENAIEHLVRLPDTPVEVFAFAQNFLYTGKVSPSLEKLPTYDILIGVWKLGHELGIEGLCDATLDAMTEFRQVTQCIPATPLLVQVWKDTPEGSSIRKLLLSWAAEYMRSSESRAEFARSLPQEVLSELVVAMSSLDSAPIQSPALLPQRRAAQQADGDESDGGSSQPAKKARYSEILPAAGAAPPGPKLAVKKVASRQSLPTSKPGHKRRSNALIATEQFSTNQKLNFCADLLTRMLSGPGMRAPRITTT